MAFPSDLSLATILELLRARASNNNEPNRGYMGLLSLPEDKLHMLNRPSIQDEYAKKPGLKESNKEKDHMQAQVVIQQCFVEGPIMITNGLASIKFND